MYLGPPHGLPLLHFLSHLGEIWPQTSGMSGKQKRDSIFPGRACGSAEEEGVVRVRKYGVIVSVLLGSLKLEACKSTYH